MLSVLVSTGCCPALCKHRRVLVGHSPGNLSSAERLRYARTTARRACCGHNMSCLDPAYACRS